MLLTPTLLAERLRDSKTRGIPDLNLVGTDHLADEQMAGTIVSASRRLIGHRACFQQVLVPMQESEI